VTFRRSNVTCQCDVRGRCTVASRAKARFKPIDVLAVGGKVDLFFDNRPIQLNLPFCAFDSYRESSRLCETNAPVIDSVQVRMRAGVEPPSGFVQQRAVSWEPILVDVAGREHHVVVPRQRIASVTAAKTARRYSVAAKVFVASHTAHKRYMSASSASRDAAYVGSWRPPIATCNKALYPVERLNDRIM